MPLWCQFAVIPSCNFWIFWSFTVSWCWQSQTYFFTFWFTTVTSISLYQLVLLDALQLAAGATGLFSQGMTAVVHGCSAHALGHNLGEETGFTMATLQEGSKNARNHTRLHSWTIYCFINLIQWQPFTEGWNQQSWLSSNISMKPCKVYNKLGLQHLYPLILFIETIAERITLLKEYFAEEGCEPGVELSRLEPKCSKGPNSPDLEVPASRDSRVVPQPSYLRSSIAWVKWTVWCPTYLSWGHMVDPGNYRED